MKRLVLIALCLIPSAAMAQGQPQTFTPVPKEQANAYFAECVKKPPSEQFSIQAQQEMCACTAARMTQFFSLEDSKLMYGTDPIKARVAYNKMMTDIYAPCMEGPTREHFYNTCIADPNNAKYGDPQKLCACLGNQMGAYMKVHGAEQYAKLLAYDPNMMDPNSALYADPSFQTFAQKQLLSCVGK